MKALKKCWLLFLPITSLMYLNLTALITDSALAMLASSFLYQEQPMLSPIFMHINVLPPLTQLLTPPSQGLTKVLPPSQSLP